MGQDIHFPIGGTDYPRTLQEFDKWFSTETDCLNYIQRLRWPNGFVCPECQSTKSWQMSTGLIRCTECKRKVSVLAGTTFHGTRKPLKVWFQAMWYITSQKLGGSALGLKRVLGLGGYQTAWSWLHKMRHAMVRPGREQLCGNVEIDETLIGGEDSGGKRGRGAGRKSIVVIAVEVINPKGFGRVRMQSIPDASAINIMQFVLNTVKPGSTIFTDCWRGYSQLQSNGYVHEKINLSEADDPAHVLMPGVHRIASLLKRWLLGTHQGAVSPQHLDYYLDEYSFRFNRRKSTARGLLFYRLLQQAVEIPTITYKSLVENEN
jgi:transposase-like protein